MVSEWRMFTLAVLVTVVLGSAEAFSSINPSPNLFNEDDFFFADGYQPQEQPQSPYDANGGSLSSPPHSYCDEDSSPSWIQQNSLDDLPSRNTAAGLPVDFFTQTSKRERFPVQFQPPKPQPPLHQPSKNAFDRAAEAGARQAVRWADQMKSSTSGGDNAASQEDRPPWLPSVLVGVLSGVWVAAPVLYVHCIVDRQTEHLVSMMLIAALETTIFSSCLAQTYKGRDEDEWLKEFEDEEETLALRSQQGPDWKKALLVAFFVGLRTAASAPEFLVYPALPVPIPFFPVLSILCLVVVESAVLMGASTAAMDAFVASYWEQQDAKRRQTVTAARQKKKQERQQSISFQRGTQW